MTRQLCQAILFVLVAAISPAAHAQSFDTKARAAFVYDLTADTV